MATSDKTNIHSGHRDRLRQTFLANGLDALPDVNALELLLFYAIPQRDTNPIAHRLLSEFGSLSGVFDASISDLMRLGGLTENAAALLKLTTDISRRHLIVRGSMDNILTTTAQCGDYLLPYFYGATEEQVYLLCLDAKCKVLSCSLLFTGTVNNASLSLRTVLECALRTKATSVVLAHNHTSGIAVPSKEDIAITGEVARALDLIGVLLADHIVVADNDYVSMRDSGMLPGGSLSFSP